MYDEKQTQLHSKTKIQREYLEWAENVSCKLFINTITWILLPQKEEKIVIKTGKEAENWEKKIGFRLAFICSHFISFKKKRYENWRIFYNCDTNPAI